MENEQKIENKPIQFKNLFNPTTEDLTFSYNSAIYTLKAGKQEPFVDYIAAHGAKKLADKNVKTGNPDEHNVLRLAYLENADPVVIAERLGVNLDKIRKDVLTKEAERSRVINLESQVKFQQEKMERMEKLLEKVVGNLEEKEEKQEEVKLVEEIKKYKCKECDKEFDQAIALAGHAKSHKK